jgi:hypothetical protein
VQCTLGAGPLAPPKSAIELDSPTAVVQAVKVDPQNDLQWTPAGSFFQQQVVPLNPGKSFTLDVQVDPQTCTCSWTLAADVMIGGRTVTLTAQNGSQPFRTAPFPKQRGRECWALDFQAKVPHLAQTSPPC